MRLAVADENYDDARIALLQAHRWAHVAILHQDEIESSLVKDEKKLGSIVDSPFFSPSADDGETRQTFERIKY